MCTLDAGSLLMAEGSYRWTTGFLDSLASHFSPEEGMDLVLLAVKRNVDDTHH